MTYLARPIITSSSGPFSQSVRSSNAQVGQFDTHTAPWVNGTQIKGSGWVQGSIYTNEATVVIGPAGLASGVGATRSYWGVCNSYNNVNRCFCDDAWVGYGSTVEWAAHPTQFASLPVMDSTRSRANVVRFAQ